MNFKKFAPYVFVLGLLLIFACSGNKEKKDDDHHDGHHDEAAAGEHEWKEMDDFHMIMAESFHPYKDSLNLEPAKVRASEMATMAASWADASLPSKVDTEEVKQKLEALKTQTALFAETAKSDDDKLIAKSLTDLHDLFHEIQEAWYGGGHEHHH